MADTIFLPAEVKGACELLNKRIFKRLARKLFIESLFRKYVIGEKYSSQDLYRDSFVKGLPCMVSMTVKRKKDMQTPEYIKVGKWTFVNVKIDTFLQHTSYTLITNNS